MATYRENLETRRSVVAAKLATLDADEAAGSKPSVKMSDGGTHIDHVEYRLSLYKELEAIQKLMTPGQAACGRRAVRLPTEI